MSQLIVENLTNTVGAKTLFNNIAFTILSGEKVGLIGINGTVNQRLLSIIAGVGDADSISMDHPNNYRIAYLPQEPEVDPNLSVMETVFMSDAPIIRMNLDYEHALKALNFKSRIRTKIKNVLQKFKTKWMRMSGWDINSKARTILTKLGIDTFDKKMGELSGGQQKRVSLAKVLNRTCRFIVIR